MSTKHSIFSGGPATDEGVPTRDDLFEILANRRRRYAIHYLQLKERAVELGTLAEQLAAWENVTPVEAVTSKERKRAYTSLQQRHLPKMDEAGLVDFDERRGTIEPSEALTNLDVYTEVVRGNEFPWSHYYAAISAITGAIMAAVWAGVFPFDALPAEAWGVFSVTVFAVSSVAHVYSTRRMKLGGSALPPEHDDAEVS